MPAKRIPDLTAISGASTANDDNLVIFDTDANETKRILRSQLAAGLVGDLPYTPSGGISATTVPTAIAELDSEAAKSAALAASGGSALVGFLQAGTGAVTRTAQSKLRDVVSVRDFGAVGDGVTDDTAAIQAAASYVSAIGGTLTFPSGDFKITTRINFAGAGVLVALSHNTGIVYNTPDYIAFKFTAANCSVVGGLGRGFVGPAAWDGANVSPTYAVLMFEGNNSVAKTRLQNVRKVGIWFKDVLDGTAEECIVEGNYPSGSYTGVEVGHIGILFDTSAASAGNFKLVNNTIKSCVQGCMPANYGTGGVTQGFVATGNIFEGCWNHGIYSNFTNGAVITGNNFNRCQIPVVISGNANVISGNTMYVSSDSAGDQRDVAGISVRDGSRNVISGNTIKGTLNASNTVCIDIRDLSGLSQINDNIVSSNTINITAGAGVAIRLRGDTNSVNRNVIESNTVTCLGNGTASGAIEINGYASGVNAGNKIVNNSITLTTYGEFFYSTYQTACEVRGNTFEIAWNSGSAVNVYATWWFQPNLCNTQDNVLHCRSGNGSNITFYLYRESSSASDNFLSNNINAVGGSATYAFGVLVANSGLTVNQLGTGVPNFHAKIGSMWRRSDGGTGSTLYIKESGTDASGWVAK